MRISARKLAQILRELPSIHDPEYLFKSKLYVATLPEVQIVPRPKVPEILVGNDPLCFKRGRDDWYLDL